MNAHEGNISGEALSRDALPPIEAFDAFEKRVAGDFPEFVSKHGIRFGYEFAEKKPQRDWLLKGVFLSRTLFLIIGEPGCGKSFLTLDWAMARALAAVDPRAPKEWFGRKTKPGATVYIFGEGQEDGIIRYHAWCQARGIPVSTKIPFILCPTALDMRSGDTDTKTLIEEIKALDVICQRDFGCRIDLLVVDTFNKALAGGDDTKPEHVGAFYKHCALLRDQIGVATAAVHHTPRGGDRARGHGSVTADNDAEIFVRGPAEGAPNSWTVTRSKAGPKGDKHEFRLRQIVLGRDEDGDDITSCHIAPGGAEGSLETAVMNEAGLEARTGKHHMTPDGRSILGGNLTIVMRALHELIERDGEFPPPDVRSPHGRRAAKMKTWLEEIIRAMPGDDKEDVKFRDRCRKARDAGAIALRNRGIIGMDGEYVWRTSRRVAMIDKQEADEPAQLPLGVASEVGSVEF